jgi:hypothetical protein
MGATQEHIRPFSARPRSTLPPWRETLSPVTPGLITDEHPQLHSTVTSHPATLRKKNLPSQPPQPTHKSASDLPRQQLRLRLAINYWELQLLCCDAPPEGTTRGGTLRSLRSGDEKRGRGEESGLSRCRQPVSWLVRGESACPAQQPWN